MNTSHIINRILLCLYEDVQKRLKVMKESYPRLNIKAIL